MPFVEIQCYRMTLVKRETLIYQGVLQLFEII